MFCLGNEEEFVLGSLIGKFLGVFLYTRFVFIIVYRSVSLLAI